MFKLNFKPERYEYVKISLDLALEKLQDEHLSFRLDRFKDQVRLVGLNSETLILIQLHNDKIEWFRAYLPSQAYLHDDLFNEVVLTIKGIL